MPFSIDSFNNSLQAYVDVRKWKTPRRTINFAVRSFTWIFGGAILAGAVLCVGRGLAGMRDTYRSLTGRVAKVDVTNETICRVDNCRVDKLFNDDELKYYLDDPDKLLELFENSKRLDKEKGLKIFEELFSQGKGFVQAMIAFKSLQKEVSQYDLKGVKKQFYKNNIIMIELLKKAILSAKKDDNFSDYAEGFKLGIRSANISTSDYFDQVFWFLSKIGLPLELVYQIAETVSIDPTTEKIFCSIYIRPNGDLVFKGEDWSSELQLKKFEINDDLIKKIYTIPLRVYETHP